MTKQAGILAASLLALLTLFSCSQQPAERRQATVTLQDGSKVSGAVVASSGSQITLADEDKATRTIPMSQVKSVEYSEPAPAPEATAPRRQPEPARESRPVVARTFELPEGTKLPVRTNETIDSAKASAGQGFAAEVSADVVNSAGTVVIPKGSPAELRIVSASEGGKVRGASGLVLTLAAVTVGGQRYDLDAADIGRRGKEGVGANKRTATYTGGGAAVGAIIGAIAGGGKGAAIGAGAGAGAGALTQIMTKGKAVRVPAESILTFRLESPLRITAE